jgi:PhnB protein
MSSVKAIPDGYHTLTPYLYVRGGNAAIAFYEQAFGAKEIFRMPGPDGRIGHAEIQIGDSRIMLSDESEKMQAFSPQHLHGTTVGLVLYVEDCDSLYHQAIAAGAKSLRPPTDEPYGDRMSGIEDPFGHKWYIATHVKDVSPEELMAMSGASN